jgi:hypothetical protein
MYKCGVVNLSCPSDLNTKVTVMESTAQSLESLEPLLSWLSALA